MRLWPRKRLFARRAVQRLDDQARRALVLAMRALREEKLQVRGGS